MISPSIDPPLLLNCTNNEHLWNRAQGQDHARRGEVFLRIRDLLEDKAAWPSTARSPFLDPGTRAAPRSRGPFQPSSGGAPHLSRVRARDRAICRGCRRKPPYVEKTTSQLSKIEKEREHFLLTYARVSTFSTYRPFPRGAAPFFVEGVEKTVSTFSTGGVSLRARAYARVTRAIDILDISPSTLGRLEVRRIEPGIDPKPASIALPLHLIGTTRPLLAADPERKHMGPTWLSVRTRQLNFT